MPGNVFVSRIRSALPFLQWMPATTPNSARSDAIAGFTNALVVISECLAYSTIAGLPLAYGLHTAIIPAIVLALFGSSRLVVAGPTTAISLTVFAMLSPLAVPGSTNYITLVLTATLLSGVFQLLLGLFRLGRILDFISGAVLTGFTAGAGVLIIIGELQNALAISAPAGISFYATIRHITDGIPQANPWAASIAATTILAALALRLVSKHLPFMLLGLIAGAVAGMWLKADTHGVLLVGALPSPIPPLSFPSFELETLRRMIPVGLAMATVGLMEAMSVARAIADQTKQRLDRNQDIVGEGAANIVGCFLSCYGSAASFTRSSINHMSGAKSPLSAILAAIFLALIVLVFGSYAAYLPAPAMSGVVVLAGFKLIHWKRIWHMLRAGRSDAVTLCVTLFMVLHTSLEHAIVFGITVSLLSFLYDMTQPVIRVLEPDKHGTVELFPNSTRFTVASDIIITRLDGDLFFGSAEHIRNQFEVLLDRHAEMHTLVLLCEAINFVDVSGGEVLDAVAAGMAKRGGALEIVRIRPVLARILLRSGVLEHLHQANFHAAETDIAGISLASESRG